VANPTSYALADFIPFTAEVYFRLLERLNEALWPLPLATLAAGMGIVMLCHRGRGAIAGLLLAAAWAWVGYRFVLVEYAQLNWAGRYFGWAFQLQALALVAIAWTGRLQRTSTGRPDGPVWPGLVIAGFGLLYPLIAPLTGRAWVQAEVFGIHPDPTAVVTLGVIAAFGRGAPVWLAVAVPVLWCLASGLTLSVLAAPWWPVMLVLPVAALAALLWRAFGR